MLKVDFGQWLDDSYRADQPVRRLENDRYWGVGSGPLTVPFRSDDVPLGQRSYSHLVGRKSQVWENCARFGYCSTQRSGGWIWVAIWLRSFTMWAGKEV